MAGIKPVASFCPAAEDTHEPVGAVAVQASECNSLFSRQWHASRREGVKCALPYVSKSTPAWYAQKRMFRCPRAAAGVLLLAAGIFPSAISSRSASAAAFNAPGTEPATPQSRELFAQNYVRDKLRIWQQRLDLNDWKLHVDLVRPSGLEPKTLGSIHWDTSAKQATIAVLSSYDYKLPFRSMLDDMEFTVVHELVHLQLASLPRSEASRKNEEHAVNELASALIRLAK